MLTEVEQATEALLLVIVLVRAPELSADVEGVTALRPEPVVHNRDAEFAIDGSTARAIAAVSGLAVEADLWWDSALRHHRGVEPR